MGTWFPGAIQIGGELSADDVTELCGAILDAGLSLDWGGEPFEPASAEDLLAAVDADTGQLRLFDDQACFGHFNDLEAWLKEHGLPFDRQSDAYCEYDGETVSFRRDVGVVWHVASQDGEPLVKADEVEQARDVLRRALQERSPERAREALQLLDQVLGPDVLSLPRFRITTPRK
jgi:hypothetical protein